MRFRHGFTLVEVVVAIGILATTLCVLLGVYSACTILVSTSKSINIATNAVLGLMEEIRTSSFADIEDYNGLQFVLNAVPESRGVVYVDDTNPELLEVTVSVCWRQGNRIIGEDANLNGALDGGEDQNGNGKIDSPVQIVTRIANR
ncbi:MAG: prepilin-type N-terminal cleavage/methylation domain-containing protein [Candidatus Omnitrophota bacterium]|nr:prepilin-type N-terminal cleavage/methylation domain-containing protein [Candidatus Omnitrophota bacterium]